MACFPGVIFSIRPAAVGVVGWLRPGKIPEQQQQQQQQKQDKYVPLAVIH